MRIGALTVFATLIIALGLMSLVPTSASEGFEINLLIPGEAPVHNGDGQPVLIAGVWHDLSLSLQATVQERLTLEASALESQPGNMSSHYMWERVEEDDSWTDLLYSFFIRPERSNSTGNQVLFHLGVDAAAVPGTWRLSITQDGTPLGEQLIEVRAPRMGYSMSAADFNLRIEPFKAATLSTEDTGQYLRISNSGNVPLRLSVTFDALASRLSLVNPSDVVHINSGTKYFLMADLDPRPPQIIKVNGIARVEVSDLIPSPGASQIVPAIESEFSLKVVIGRSGYTVQALGNVFFQTIETLRADYGSVVAWQVYLTGDEEVSLDVQVIDAELVGVWLGDDPLTLPASLSPSPQTELPLAIQVRASVPSTYAEVHFTLHLMDSGQVQTYRTIIVVGAKPPSPPLKPSLLWFFASLVSASVLAITTYNHWRFVNMGSAGWWMGNSGRPDKEKGRGGRGAGNLAKVDGHGKTKKDKRGRVDDE